VFLGPLAQASVAGASGQVEGGFIDTIIASGSNLKDASDAATDWAWVVLNGLDATSTTTLPVDNGWVDNAFDTQRRRGLRPTVRTTFGP